MTKKQEYQLADPALSLPTPLSPVVHFELKVTTHEAGN